MVDKVLIKSDSRKLDIINYLVRERLYSFIIVYSVSKYLFNKLQAFRQTLI